MTTWQNRPAPTLGEAYDYGGYGEGPYGGAASDPDWENTDTETTTWTNRSISESTTWGNAL